ncbi:CLUMA_CG013461, isoform A [Clunio marinus]|uniref:CLUMA_CG013461, isoform A n=1 Tax=Clunio marinus TaxID=568069 RepID=A0A1J1IIY7_9DIPT|nr:CLUMA_CG013461, isoform A [Clunio marinus]
MGRYNQSLEIFLKAESLLDSPDHEVYHYIGDLLRLNVKHNKENILDAKDYFKRSIMCGKQIKTYKTLADIYRKEKDYLKAIELLENCVSPGNIEFLPTLGILYLKVNEVDRAYGKLEEAISIDDKHAESLLAFGAIMQTKNDGEAALNVYKKIPNLQDESFEIWNNIGMCFYRKNKLIAAISCLKKALWMCPLNFNVLYNLGVVLMTAQQFASAFQCFVSAVSRRPDNAESFMMLAICLYYLNDTENAQIAFRKSIFSSSAIKNPLIYLNYSIFCLECLKNPDETQQYLNNFYNLCDTMKVPNEYVQIAEVVLSKLPSTLPFPETKTVVHQVKETKIPQTQNEKTDSDAVLNGDNEHDKEQNKLCNIGDPDDDLV